MRAASGDAAGPSSFPRPSSHLPPSTLLRACGSLAPPPGARGARGDSEPAVQFPGARAARQPPRRSRPAPALQRRRAASKSQMRRPPASRRCHPLARRAAPLPPAPPAASRLPPSRRPRAPRAPSRGSEHTHPFPHGGGGRRPARGAVARESERRGASGLRLSERGRADAEQRARAAARREGGSTVGGSDRCRRRWGCYRCCCCHVSTSSRRCSAPKSPPQFEPAPPPHFLKYATCVLATPTPRDVNVTGAT